MTDRFILASCFYLVGKDVVRAIRRRSPKRITIPMEPDVEVAFVRDGRTVSVMRLNEVTIDRNGARATFSSLSDWMERRWIGGPR